jgi:hypothetical protein
MSQTTKLRKKNRKMIENKKMSLHFLNLIVSMK